MKYKVGDKVRVKSWEQLSAQYPQDYVGNLICGDDLFTSAMREYCGKTLTIVDGRHGRYVVEETVFYVFTDEMIEDGENDVVNHPSHYTQGGIECIDAMKAAFGADELAVYCKIAAFKYVWRCDHKNGLEDIKKAIWYLNKYLELKEGNASD